MMSDKSTLEDFKSLILLKNNIRVLSPSDCKAIAIDIQKEVKKNISETTIKRIFGFAEIKHEFSLFTVNTIKEYVGLSEASAHDSAIAAQTAYSTVKTNAATITDITLQHIENRSGLPYELTIPRNFAKVDFEVFYHSKFSFTALIAHPGDGKSILISHLVDDLFMAPNSPFKEDIILLINADEIFTKENNSSTLEDIIKAKLGLNSKTKLVDYFDKEYLASDRKFVLIVDGFSDLIINKNTSPKIFDRMIAFIETIGESESIKFMFSLRPTTWNRIYMKIRFAHAIRSKWFSGSHFNVQSHCNIPELSETEVEQIFNKISPTDFHKISSSLKSQLKFPFHIQWYYQLREEYPDFESFTNIVHYEIIALFIQEKIFYSTYSTEKLLFCKKIVYLTNYGRREDSVSKIDLIREFPVFTNAYVELLTDGILMEEMQIRNGVAVEVVRFIQPHVFEYFLFIELYDLFENNLDHRFFELVQHEYSGNHVRFQLLQWATRMLIRLRKFKELEAVFDLDLNNYEKNYLIYFTAENLTYLYKKDARILEEIRSQNLHQLLIKKLIHFDFIDSCYKDAIECLLLISDRNETTLFYHAVLAIFECLSLDREKILSRLNSMSAYSLEASSWEINPIEVVRVVYLKLIGNNSTANKIFAQVENFKEQKNHFGDYSEFPEDKQILTYLLILTANLFYGSPREAIKIIGSISQRHPKLLKRRRLFSIYLLNLVAQASARSNPGKKTDQMESILSNLYSDESSINPTLYARSVLLSLKAEQSKNRGEFQQAICYATECLEIYQRNELTINQIFTYNLMIDIYTELNDHQKIMEYEQLKINLLSGKNTHLEVFKHSYYI